EAIRRSRRALREFRIEGVASPVGFHRWLLEQPEFLAGTHTTTYLTDVLRRSQIPREVPT
ncbi:MAG: hypothetical protein GEU89_21380, partial [Kiloniellaceae bacterium]|nr:hypothetical protein [Kiloniellaceae bacterium]